MALPHIEGDHVEVDLCDCCATLAANGDDSGCRDYHRHTHPSMNLPGAVLTGDTDERWRLWTCGGCGTEQLPGAVALTAVVLP